MACAHCASRYRARRSAPRLPPASSHLFCRAHTSRTLQRRIGMATSPPGSLAPSHTFLSPIISRMARALGRRRVLLTVCGLCRLRLLRFRAVRHAYAWTEPHTYLHTLPPHTHTTLPHTTHTPHPSYYTTIGGSPSGTVLSCACAPSCSNNEHISHTSPPQTLAASAL